MVDREQDVLRAASMYYLQDMTMAAIAKHLHTSRSTVSRLVKRARGTGLVEISLRPARSRGPGLGPHLATTRGIDAYLVTEPGQPPARPGAPPGRPGAPPPGGARGRRRCRARRATRA